MGDRRGLYVDTPEVGDTDVTPIKVLSMIGQELMTDTVSSSRRSSSTSNSRLKGARKELRIPLLRLKEFEQTP